MDEEQVTDHLPLPNLPRLILAALTEEPRHGWGVIQRIEQLTQGQWSPSSGSLYMAIGRLLDQRLIEAVPGPSGDRSTRGKYYTLTALGKRVLAADCEHLSNVIRVAAAASSK